MKSRQWAMRFLGSMLVLSLLVPDHFMPWPAFRHDFVVGLGFIPFGCYVMRRQLRVPKIAILLLVLSITPLVQIGMGELLFFGDAWVSWLYISAAAFVLIFSANFTAGSKLGNPILEVLPLIFAFIVVAILSTGISLIQWLDLSFFPEFVTQSQVRGRYGANLAQPNQLAIILLIGVACNLFLFENKVLSSGAAIFLASFLMLGLVMTQSRMVFLALLFLWALYWRLRRQASLRTSGKAILSLSMLFGLTMLAWPSINEALLLREPSSLIGRTNKDVRFDLWQSMIDAAAQSPWLGYGWGQVPVAQQLTALKYPATHAFFDSAHNIILDVAIATGVPLAIVLSGWLILWFKRQILNCHDPLSWSVLLAVGFVFCHAMVEYPLAYAYILLPICFFMGALSRSEIIALPANRSAKNAMQLTLFGVAGATLIGFFVLSLEYIRFEDDWRRTRLIMSGIYSDEDQAKMYVPFFLTQLGGYSEFSRLRPERGMAEQKIFWMNNVAQRFGQPSVLTRYAIAAALNGRPEMAARSLALVCKTQTPSICLKTLESWREISSNPSYPELKLVALPNLS